MTQESNVEALAKILASLQENRSQYLSAAGAQLLAREIRRLQAAEEQLELARQTLVEDGYFTADQVGDDVAPRLIEWLSHHRGRMTATTRIDIDDDVLWARMLPRLERWADDRNRRDRAAFASMPRTAW